MVCPSSHVSKLLLVLLVIVLVFYVYMDFNLYLRIQNYPLDSDGTRYAPTTGTGDPDDVISISNYSQIYYEDVTWFGCEISPLCDVTVKALLLDHTNYYLFAPLVTLMDKSLEISANAYVTPNSISIFHVFVAMLAAKCVSSDSLAHRRVGVLLFELRTFLDDLDGHVARVRAHVKGERSDVGSTGYYVDGICDAIGCTALVVGTFVFVKNNPPRRGYMQLPVTNAGVITSGSVDGKEGICASTGIVYKSKITSTDVYRKISCFAAQLVLSSAAWNRYIALYQVVLERRSDISPEELARQTTVFRSHSFFVLAWLWRVINVHNMLHFMLLSVFCDKLWEFLRCIQYAGFAILLFVIGLTEVHLSNVWTYVCATRIVSAAAPSSTSNDLIDTSSFSSA